MKTTDELLTEVEALGLESGFVLDSMVNRGGKWCARWRSVKHGGHITYSRQPTLHECLLGELERLRETKKHEDRTD